MKYRVKQVGKFFFPQYKQWFRWRNFEQRKQGMGIHCVSSYLESLPVVFENLQDSCCFIRDHMDRVSEDTPIYHPVE
ncbi:hypothetical protein CKDKEFKM_00025 [Pseudomonas phage phiPA01_EW]|nr:hypothetical protein CKDKEFKM_00025 [Pseudomonas phage phiPA01_EW]